MNETTLPNLLILGQQKAGTTWLFGQLETHPEVLGSTPKELFLFSKKKSDIARRLPDYRSKFPLTSGKKYYLEGSATYFWVRERGDVYDDETWLSTQSWNTHNEVHRLLGGGVKMIVLFRQPVARAISAFYHNFRKKRLGAEQRITEVGSRFGILGMGRVAYPWKQWRKAFPRENFLFLNFDHIKSEPDSLMSTVYDFLELAPPESVPKRSAPKGKEVRRQNAGFKLRVGTGGIEVDTSSQEKANSAWLKGSDREAGVAAPRVSFSEIIQLQELFQPEIDTMEDLLGQDLSHWRDVTPEQLLKF